MTEQLALNLSDMVKYTLSGRGMATRKGFPEEVTSGTSRVLKEDIRDQFSRKSKVRVVILEMQGVLFESKQRI